MSVEDALQNLRRRSKTAFDFGGTRDMKIDRFIGASRHAL